MNLRNKKSASGEAQFNGQFDCTTSEATKQAEFIFSLIGTGPEHAVRGPSGQANRVFRRLVAEANKNGDCIINTGGGYYRPGEEDEPDLRHYLRSEMHRAQEILDKVAAMSVAYNRGGTNERI